MDKEDDIKKFRKRRRSLRTKDIGKRLNLDDLFKFDWKLLTVDQKLFVYDLNSQFELNLNYDFFDSYDKLNQLIHCFAFHKDSDDRFHTGHQRIDDLRNLYWYETSPHYLADKLNAQINDDDYKFTPNDIEFMVMVLSKSKNPLKTYDHIEDPEDIQFQKELEDIEEMSNNYF